MFGDSITEYGNWDQLLATINVTNRGIAGDTTTNLLVRFDRSIDKDTDIVFLMAGINDLIQKVSIQRVLNNYINILEKLQALNIKPIVQSTLFVGEEFHNFYPNVNKNVEELNTKLLNYCNENKIIWLDINSVLAPNKILETQYTNDSVHINKKAYIEWAEYIKQKIFKEKR